MHRGEAQVSRITPEEARSTAANWSELSAWARDRRPAWYHVSGVRPDNLEELVREAGIRDEDLSSFSRSSRSVTSQELLRGDRHRPLCADGS